MTLKSTLITAALAATLLVGSAVAAFAGPASMDDDAKLYAHPGAGVIGSVDEDDDIWVNQCHQGFCLIRDDGSTGWVKTSAIDFGNNDDDDDDDGDDVGVHLSFGDFGHFGHGGHGGHGHHHHH